MINVALESLSVEEKLRMMESLWDSLFYAAATIDSPNWRGEVLAEREQGVSNGTDQFESWEIAKETLRNQLT
ncbi:addiction module protein [Methylomonas sp. SURF-2]|uniref:Addiction module protein n=1 Tax=Methylomonas subterranea TaxID=2952225 RepID=A0ABT1TGU0_9GAMM|nr:addiction module protein [Methylomonas sp. SURF-2]MCQ8104677.1 addiction module protein [Methylomonas sp. SURF-2]